MAGIEAYASEIMAELIKAKSRLERDFET